MKKEKEATTFTVARINNVEIVVIENGEKRIAVKPICDILGIASNGQIEKIKTDPLFSSTYKTVLSVGADGKEREMFTIPFQDVFGWLFRIDSRNVKPEAKEFVEKYQRECYDTLYNHFSGFAEFIKQKEQLLQEKLTLVEAINFEFHDAKNKLIDAKKELTLVRNLTFEDFDMERRQLKMFSEEEMEG